MQPFFLQAVLWLLLLIGWLPASGLASAPQIPSVQVGLDGQYKLGHWTAVQITLTGGEQPAQGELVLSTPDGDGVETRFVAGDGSAVAVPAGQQVQVWRYVKFGRIRGGLKVEWRTERGGMLASRSFAAGELARPLSSTQRWIVTVGRGIGVEEAVRQRIRGQSERIVTGQIEQAGQLPDHWCGYQGVDTLVVSTSQRELFEGLSDSQFEALQRWVHLGGRLVLCAGPQGAAVVGPESRLGRLVPGQVSGVTSLRRAARLESYTGAVQRLDVASGQPAGQFVLEMAELAEVRGDVELSEGGWGASQHPAIVRTPLGFGQVVFVAFDLDQPPFSQWEARPRLVAKLLESDGGDARRERQREERLGQVAHVGYQDMVGQLRAALDQFDGVTPVAFSWVAALIVLYILLIGPGDYFLLRKLRRMHWTWVTFPLVLVGFCLLAYWLGGTLKGPRLGINQVDLVDVDLETGTVRGTMWAHVYSPRTEAYNLALEPAWQPESDGSPGEGMLSWQGLPGTGLGGLNTAATAALFTEPYLLRSPPQATEPGQAAIQGLPIQVAGTRSLTARWSAELAAADDQGLTADPVTGMLRGTIHNPLPVELSDCRLLYQNWLYRLDRLAPGQSVRMDHQRSRNLEWYLTRRQVVETKDVATPWDQSSFDVPRILEVMMFHGASGGQAYTQLSHRYQVDVDLSDHLRAGRAILVGRSPQPASRLARDGQPLDDHYQRHWTFYRVVLPVQRPSGSP